MGGKKGGERGSSEKRVSAELVSGLESCLVENETREVNRAQCVYVIESANRN